MVLFVGWFGGWLVGCFWVLAVNQPTNQTQKPTTQTNKQTKQTSKQTKPTNQTTQKRSRDNEAKED